MGLATELLAGLARCRRGAVAPTVALSLIGLVAAGGIAFDYAHVAAMSTELQAAADQAALAAATQLDGQPGACARAGAAAAALLANQSLLANDGSGAAVTVANEPACDAIGDVKFYQGWNQATDVAGAAATTDANAKVVEIAVGGRTANFALTPVVAALGSSAINAKAVASLGSAICKTPPVMICNPQESTDPTFTTANYVGFGIKLVSVGNGGGTWAPGNFGYLNSSGGSNGAPGLREALGWAAPPGNCIASNGVSTKPGASVSVTDALNTRFDIYDSNQACNGSGYCPASINSVKDVTRKASANSGVGCTQTNGTNGWNLPTNYYGSTATIPSSASAPLVTSVTPASMGHPRDMCHAVASGTAGECTSPVGNGTWDSNAYFRANYVRSDNTYWTGGTGVGSWRNNTGLLTSVVVTAANYASRYHVYQWEIANRGTTVDGVSVLGPRIVSGGSGPNAQTSYGLPQCSNPQGYGTGTVPGIGTVDRRRISVAVVNCTVNGVNGNSTNVPVQKWMEAFLVEPSINRARTAAGDVYIEVIGETTSGGAGATAGQVVRHDKPYLIK